VSNQPQHVTVLRAPDRHKKGPHQPGWRPRLHRYRVLENGVVAELLRDEVRGIALATAYSFLDALGWYWHFEMGCKLTVTGDTRIEGYRNGVKLVTLEIVEVE